MFEFPASYEEISIAELCTKCLFWHNTLGYQGSSNIDFRFQCPMDWAAFRNFEQSVFLRFIDIAAQLNLTIDAGPESPVSFHSPCNPRRESGNAEAVRSRAVGPILYAGRTTEVSSECKPRGSREATRRVMVPNPYRKAQVRRRAADDRFTLNLSGNTARVCTRSLLCVAPASITFVRYF